MTRALCLPKLIQFSVYSITNQTTLRGKGEQRGMIFQQSLYGVGVHPVDQPLALSYIIHAQNGTPFNIPTLEKNTPFHIF